MPGWSYGVNASCVGVGAGFPFAGGVKVCVGFGFLGGVNGAVVVVVAAVVVAASVLVAGGVDVVVVDCVVAPGEGGFDPVVVAGFVVVVGTVVVVTSVVVGTVVVVGSVVVVGVDVQPLVLPLSLPPLPPPWFWSQLPIPPPFGAQLPVPSSCVPGPQFVPVLVC